MFAKKTTCGITAAKRSSGLSREDAFSVLSELPVGADISVNGDGFDAELYCELRDGCIAVRHGRLRKAHLCFGQREFSPPTAPPTGTYSAA